MARAGVAGAAGVHLETLLMPFFSASFFCASFTVEHRWKCLLLLLPSCIDWSQRPTTNKQKTSIGMRRRSPTHCPPATTCTVASQDCAIKCTDHHHSAPPVLPSRITNSKVIKMPIVDMFPLGASGRSRENTHFCTYPSQGKKKKNKKKYSR